jgi:hypothetical protein
MSLGHGLPKPSRSRCCPLVTVLHRAMLHVRCTTLWMQTIGATLVAVERCSLVRIWMPAHGSRSAGALLYLAAVRDDWREHQPCPVRGPIRFQVCAAGPAQVMESVAWTALPTESGFWEWSSSVSARQVAMHELP